MRRGAQLYQVGDHKEKQLRCGGRKDRRVRPLRCHKYAGDPRIENNVNKLAKFSTKQRIVDYAGRLILNDKDEPTISFGKHKGKTAREVYFSEPSYFAWIDNGDFTLDTKRQFASLKAKFEEEKKAAMPRKTAPISRTKGYTPFEGLGDLFSQED